MPGTVTCIENSNTAIHLVFEGNWTLEDYRAALLHAESLSGSAGCLTGIILDFQQTNMLPERFLFMYQRMLSAYIRYPLPVIISAREGFVRNSIAYFESIYQSSRRRTPMLYADTLDDAFEMLPVQTLQMVV